LIEDIFRIPTPVSKFEKCYTDSEAVEKPICGKFAPRVKKIFRKIIYKIIPASIFLLHNIHLPQSSPLRQIHNS
jgi:hypothetical protein